MYAYEWDASTGGIVLTPMTLAFSKEPRPVYYRELDLLGFDKYWLYDKNDSFPCMWAEANNYYYDNPEINKQNKEVELIDFGEDEKEEILPEILGTASAVAACDFYRGDR